MDHSFLADPGAVWDWRTVVLHDAADHGGLLSELPATAAELAERTGADRRGVTVVMDALAAFGIVACDDGRYHPGPEALDPEAAAVVAHHARVIRQWGAGVDARLRGEPPATAGPGDRSPEARRRWYDALAAGARRRAPAVVEACLAAVPDPRRALDLGGGHGEYAAALARRDLAVVLQDLPEAIDAVRDRPALQAPGIELFAADAFERLPEGPFDIVLCAGITHIFDAERNAVLAERLAAVTRPGGVVAIHTFLRGLDPLAALFAVQMMVVGNGGTHAVADYARWYGDAGFDVPQVVDLGEGARHLLILRRT